MYVEFLEALLAYERALNSATASIDETDGLTPHVQHIPVILDDSLCGFLRDEVGGTYGYFEATEDEMTWWDARPWRKRHNDGGSK